jgi:replicative DNA helicase
MPNSDPLDRRGLPQSLSAERMILGSLINGALDFHTCRAMLSADDFALEAHRTIYRKIEQMCQAGIAIDHAIVAQALLDSNELESVGGLGYLVDLDNETPRLPHFDEYLSIV